MVGITFHLVYKFTLQSCSPGDNSSKGCLEKQREQAKSGVEVALLMVDYYLILWLNKIQAQLMPLRTELTLDSKTCWKKINFYYDDAKLYSEIQQL